MAGVLIYTAAPDSEGTLGELVSLDEPEQLRRHLRAALRDAAQCASDPLCAEHAPSQQGTTVHAVACHACSRRKRRASAGTNISTALIALPFQYRNYLVHLKSYCPAYNLYCVGLKKQPFLHPKE